jgi:hypothetical protein
MANAQDSYGIVDRKVQSLQSKSEQMDILFATRQPGMRFRVG